MGKRIDVDRAQMKRALARLRIDALFARMQAQTKEGRALRRAYEAGAAAAAHLADQYNGSTSHEYRLGDCILGKMNIRKAKPRRNALRKKSAHSTRDHLLSYIAEELRRKDEAALALVRGMTAETVRLTKKIARRAKSA